MRTPKKLPSGCPQYGQNRTAEPVRLESFKDPSLVFRRVSQRQKQRTNENRARRLGTGQGIARTKPQRASTPMWAWILAATGIVALVAAVAVVVLTRGSSSSTPSASVLTQRDSTQKIDFAVEGTWAPNYTNLGDALKVMNLPGLSETVEHYHVHIRLVVDGHDNVIIPADMGLDRSNQVYSPIHTHDERGVIHVEADRKDFRATIGNVFDVWGVRLTNQCIGGYCNGVKVYVNGKPVSNFRDYKLQAHDAVTIVEGTPPAGFTPDKSYNFLPNE
jgi:hypothetical protein